MEHDSLIKWKNKNGVMLDEVKEKKLVRYAEMIHEANKKFNVTGFKTIDDIIENLIIGSIDPLFLMNVPRGTVFADVGTGAGIPGIPLAIYHDNWRGVSIDSNSKKVSFVESVIHECAIDNLRAYNGRLEDLARDRLREAFDYVFSRALGEIFFVLEIGAPLLKTGGLLYVYSNAAPKDLSPTVCRHAEELGLTLLDRSRYADYGINETGIVLVKTMVTGSRYPRKMTAIKRDIHKMGKD